MARFQSGSGGEAAQSGAMCGPGTTPSRGAPREPGHSMRMIAGVTAAAGAMGADGGTAGAVAAVVTTGAAGPISGVPAGESGATPTAVGPVALGGAGAGIVAGAMAGAGAVSSTSRCSAVF